PSRSGYRRRHPNQVSIAWRFPPVLALNRQGGHPPSLACVQIGGRSRAPLDSSSTLVSGWGTSRGGLSDQRSADGSGGPSTPAPALLLQQQAPREAYKQRPGGGRPRNCAAKDTGSPQDNAMAKSFDGAWENRAGKAFRQDPASSAGETAVRRQRPG